MLPWAPMLKVFGTLAAAGSLMQSCNNAAQSGADRVDNFVNPPVCEDHVNGTTGTTVIDGTTFGYSELPDGTRTLTRELGECHR